MQALLFVLAVIPVALAGWVYFDAVDRGIRFGWLWALVVLLLVPPLVGFLVLLAYLVARSSLSRLEVAQGAPLRLYLVDTTFSALVLTVAGAATAVGTALAYAVSDALSSDDFRDITASAISALVVGAIVWWPHWTALTRRASALEDDAQFRSLWSLRRTEVLTAVFAFGSVAVVAALYLLGGAITALFHTSYGAAVGWLPSLGVLVATGSAAWYHVEVYRRDSAGPLQARFARLPVPTRAAAPPAPRSGPAAAAPAARGAQVPAQGAPPAPAGQPAVPSQAAAAPGPAAPPSGAVFCVRCGAQGAPDDVFCRACGTRCAQQPPAQAGATRRTGRHV